MLAMKQHCSICRFSVPKLSESYLLHKGISEERMQVAGRGATRALFQNSTESGREKNRRVEITMIKP